jgi:hypothetical protein
VDQGAVAHAVRIRRHSAVGQLIFEKRESHAFPQPFVWHGVRASNIIDIGVSVFARGTSAGAKVELLVTWATAHRPVYQSSTPVQSDPTLTYPNGTLPSPYPQFGERSPVQPAPEPLMVPAFEGADPMLNPLPPPPQLPPQARTGQRNPSPPLPELPDLSDVTPNPKKFEKLPDVPSFKATPESFSEPQFSTTPKQIPSKQRLAPVPRVAELPLRTRQPVQLETPELDSSTESINADPFEVAPQELEQSAPAEDIAVPLPIEDDENLDLVPVPSPPKLNTAIETQPLKAGEVQDAESIDYADAESNELPPHSA